MIRHPPIPTLFPSPTLFRSLHVREHLPPKAIHLLALEARLLVDAELEPVDTCDAYEQLLERGERVGVEIFRRYALDGIRQDRKSTRLNSSHLVISYAVFCLN